MKSLLISKKSEKNPLIQKVGKLQLLARWNLPMWGAPPEEGRHQLLSTYKGLAKLGYIANCCSKFRQLYADYMPISATNCRN